MGWPEEDILVPSLGTHSAQSPGKIENVQLLGHAGRLNWKQEASALRVALPREKPAEYALALKIALS